jgi:zinc transport system permease protein
MIELLEYEFMRNAFMAALLVSLACGIVGTYVFVKKIVFISGGIAHSAFGGLGIGYFLGINPLLAAIPFSIFSAIAIGIISLGKKISEDSAIGMLWSVGMATGAIFIYLSPGFAPDLFGYLFGNILSVPAGDLMLMLALDVLIVAAALVFYREFAYISFDSEYASVVGVRDKLMYIILLCMVALSVVLLIGFVGIVLVIALLTMPAAISRRFTNSLGKMMLLSTLVGAAAAVSGLLVSFYMNLPSGPVIVLLLFSAFLASMAKRT